jgi:hypothetical protein
MLQIVDDRVIPGEQFRQRCTEQTVIVTFYARLHPAFAPLSDGGED